MAKLRNAAVSGIVRGLGVLATMVAYFAIARFYRPEVAADFYLALTVSTIVTPIALLGMQVFSVKKIAAIESMEEAKSTIIGIFRLFVSISFPLSLVALAVVYLFKLDAMIGTQAVFAIFFLIPSVALLGAFLQSRKFFNKAIVVINISFFFALSCVVALINWLGLFEGEIGNQLNYAFLIAALIAFAISIGLVLKSLHISGSELLRKSSLKVIERSEISEISRFWGINILVVLNNWLPQIIYYNFSDGSDYAYFAVAQRVANVVGFFIIVSNFLLAPYLSELNSQRNLEKLKEVFFKFSLITSALALPFTIFLVIWPGFILQFFGESYTEGGHYLALLACVQFINVATGSSNVFLNMTGRSATLLIIMVTSLIAGLCTIYVLLPIYGGWGVALGLATTLTLQNALTFAVVIRVLFLNKTSVD